MKLSRTSSHVHRFGFGICLGLACAFRHLQHDYCGEEACAIVAKGMANLASVRMCAATSNAGWRTLILVRQQSLPLPTDHCLGCR